MRILVVEDDFIVQDFIKSLNEKWGYEIDFSANAADAMQKFNKSEYDLILLDVFLPDAKGYDLIPVYKKIQPHIGIIVMTGNNTPELELKVRETGILYYLIKPFKSIELSALFEHYSKKFVKDDN